MREKLVRSFKVQIRNKTINMLKIILIDFFEEVSQSPENKSFKLLSATS